MHISSNLSQLLENDTKKAYPLRNVPPKIFASAHGNLPTNSKKFLNNSFFIKTPENSNNGNARNNIRKAPFPPFNIFVLFC